MSRHLNIVAYINKKYTIEKDAFETANSTLNKLLQEKLGLSINDLPNTVDVFDTQCEAEILIKNKQYNEAADLLLKFVENNDIFF